MSENFRLFRQSKLLKENSIEKGIPLKDVFEYKDSKWVSVDFKDIINKPICHFMDGTQRVCAKMELNDGTVFYITSHKEDAVILRQKHKDDPVVYLSQIVGILSQDDILDKSLSNIKYFKNILFMLTTNDGIVVDNKEL